MAALNVEPRDGAAASSPALPARRAQRGVWTAALQRLWHDRLAVLAMLVLAAVVVLAAAADVLSAVLFHWSYSQQDLLKSYARPSLSDPALWLGSDELGRSQIVRLLYGGRVSLAVGFGAALISLSVGLALGLTGGYFRGWLDDALQWAIATLNVIPSVFLLLVVAVLFAPGPVGLIVILGLLSWPGIALFVRGQTLALREREFITAGRAVGASDRRLMLAHLLPNLLPLVFVVAAVDVGSVILAESALSFLGLGISPPTPSWGNMLANASAAVSRGPWLVYGPGVAIFSIVLCLYVIGDGLRDALDPRAADS